MESDRRKEPRQDGRTRVTHEQLGRGVVPGGVMGNFSSQGMYFETDLSLAPGEEVYLGIEDSPYAPAAGTYECLRGTLRWRRELRESEGRYGYGVQWAKEEDWLPVEFEPEVPALKPPAPGKPKARGESRVHPRKNLRMPVHLELEGIPNRGTIRNLSAGGLFVECPEPVQKGQGVRLVIPPGAKNREIRLEGRVVWSNPAGFGLALRRRAAG